MNELLPLKLKVEVLKARDLIAADTNGKSDPYCRIVLGNKVFSTSVQPNTLNPEWHQSVAFINDDLAPFATLQESADDSCTGKILLLGYLLIEIWDRDFGNPDDFIGRLVISLSSLPVQQVDANKESWHSLRRVSSQAITGEILLNVTLESVEDDKLCLANEKLNNDFYTVSKALAYHLPVLCNNKEQDYPGNRELVEIGFSKVYIQQGLVSVEAMLLLTNFRLIILMTGDGRSGGGNVTSSSSISQSITANTDLNMWIALNNIASIEHGASSTVVRRHQLTGEAENVESTTIKINCYDCRYLQIVFVMSPASGTGVSVVKSTDQPVPLKILKRVKRSRRKAINQLKRLKRIKKSSMKREESSSDSRARSGALFQEVLTQETTEEQGCSLLKESSEFRQLDPGLREGLDNASCEDEDTEDDEEGGSGEDFDQNGDDCMIHPSEQDLKAGIVKTIDDDLEMAYKGILLPSPNKVLVASLKMRLEDIAANVADKPPSIYDWAHDKEWHYSRHDSRSALALDDVMFDKWDTDTVLLKDMQRLMNDKWRVCAVNSQRYTVCPSYPRNVFIPTRMKSDPDIEEIAKFRSKGRIPSLVWMDKVTSSFLLRSAQPLTGTAGKRCKEDEQLISDAITSGPPGGGMTIFDARSFAAVQGNKLMGKGTEDIAYYPGCRLVYLDIPNIHAVRESYEGVKTLIFSSSSSKWLSNLENTQWLSYISLIIKGASMIARYLGYQNGSALVHCSDGWDRTAQLTSLTQLMLDSYYRTIEGFTILIDKEWLAYGHKFKDRLGHPLHPNERSPIFLQFLDCVHQIMSQHQTSFEFTESLLLTIAEHINTKWFGTFLYNCDKERSDKHLFSRTVSLWSHVEAIKETLKNRQYIPNNEKLIPSWSIRRLKFWDEYFLMWDGSTLSVTPTATGLENDPAGMTTGTGPMDTPGCTDQINPSSDNNTGGGVVNDHEFDTVVWMSNDKASACLICQQKFTFTKRKHHCRNCGRIYCNDCSKNRLTLDHLGYTEPVRVCDNCYRIQNTIVSQMAANQVDTHTEDGFQIFEVRKDSMNTDSEKKT